MSDRVRLVTFNVLSLAEASGPTRREVAKRALASLGADVVALQEVTHAEAEDLLGPEFTVVDLPDGGGYAGECLATRCSITGVDKLDRALDGGPATARAGAVAVEVIGPGLTGRLLVVHHRAAFELHLEHVRERQAVATARFVEDLAADRPELPVVLLGDFNAGPDAASIRFLTGRQSLDGVGVRYEDAWEAVHGDQPGHTFEPGNALVRAGQMPLERGRRIDHIMVRSGSHGPLLDVADCRLILTEPVNGIWASDHYGLLADLQPPPRSPGSWA